MKARQLAAYAGMAMAASVSAQPQDFLMVVNGPAFTPTSDPRAIMLLNPQNGAMVNPTFIPGAGAQYQMDFPRDVMQVGGQIWVTDQTEDVILRFDLLGNFLGSINGNMDNIRGMEVHQGVVYVTNATAAGLTPANSLAQFDFFGNYLGAFSVGTSPFDVILFDNQLVVGHGTGQDLTRWALDGSSLGLFHDGAISLVLQLHHKTSSGNLLAAGSSTPAGIYEYDAAGTQVGSIAVTGPRSGYELGDGNILYTNSTGVRVYDTVSGTSTLVTSAPGHYINRLSVDTSATGACCLPGGTCQILSMSACGSQSGSFRGPGTACPPACPQPGACCLSGGTCVIAQPQACADQGGVWYGPGSACGTCLSFLRSAEPSSSFIAPNGSGVFLDLTASTALTVPRIDVFPVLPNGAQATIDIYTRPGTYVGFTGGPEGWTHTETLTVLSLGGTLNPTRLTLTSPISVGQGQTVGVYIVGTVGGVRYRPSATTMSDANLTVFSNTVRGALFGGTQSSPRGFAGAVFYSLTGGCYANCDASTVAPVLTANDFQCFLNRYVNGDPYANCDGSTTPPTLTANDFICFIGAYAAGCS